MFLCLSLAYSLASLFFFFNDTATTEIYTLSLHDALPICSTSSRWRRSVTSSAIREASSAPSSSISPIRSHGASRSEEHTSELQSHSDLVCRLLLEKKNIPTKFASSIPPKH